ncbi:MAG: AraC family transcriptional regulator [Clostridia bacterium]
MPQSLNYVGTRLGRSLNVDVIYSFHYYEYAPNYFGVEESHDFWEMVYVDSGSIICYAGNQTIRLSQGQVIFHPPSERHNILAAGTEGSACILAFGCGQMEPSLFSGRPVQLDKAERELIASIYQEGNHLFAPPYNVLRQEQVTCYEDALYGAAQILRNLLENLLLLVVRGLVQPESTRRVEPLQRAVARRSHYSEKVLTDNIVALMNARLFEHLTIEEICKATAFSKSHIHTTFKKQTGYSVMGYFNKLKIDCAKKLIAEGKYTFTQVSALLGFGSIHYFSRVFRDYVKMSPTEYERSVKMQALL